MGFLSIIRKFFTIPHSECLLNYSLLVFFFICSQSSYAGSTFSKLSAAGIELADSAVEWSCVRDNVTGHLWEVKTNKNKADTYTYTDAADYALNHINVKGLCGYSDWRVPAIEELTQLVDKTSLSPALDDFYFPNTRTSFYWSAARANITTLPDNAWGVLFDAGHVSPAGLVYSGAVRLIRTQQSPDASDYTKLDANGDDLSDNAPDWSCVRDNHSALIWAVNTRQNSSRYRVDAAAEYVNGINSQNLCGFTDWRVPEINELEQIVDYSQYPRSIDAVYFPDTISSAYWSASSYAGVGGRSWYVSFYQGRSAHDDNDESKYLRLVRGGRNFTKISLTGTALPFAAKRWSCLRDSLTGQVWEAKTQDNKEDTYSFEVLSKHVSDLNKSNLCGFSDWRVPTLKELNHIVDKTQDVPAVDRHFFPHTLSTQYWSALTDVTYFGSAWYINFGPGSSNTKNKTTAFSSRLVRGAEAFELLDYTKLDANGHDLADSALEWFCVRDNKNNLIWEVKNNRTQYHRFDYHRTSSYVASVNSQNLCGYSDWRMPDIEELISLVDHRTADAAINMHYFPYTQNQNYASATLNAADANKMWGVSFSGGGWFNYGIGFNSYVRLVRKKPSIRSNFTALPAMHFLLF